MRKLWLRVTTRSWRGPRASGSKRSSGVLRRMREGIVATFLGGMLDQQLHRPKRS